MPYIELHARSAFSFLRGASLPETLAKIAVKQGISTMALCDRDGVHGAPRFYSTGQEVGLRALVGSELTLEDESILPVLVKNRTGYKNLCRMITQAQLRAAKGTGRISWAELGEFHEGLVALTGYGEGPLHRSLIYGDRAAAEASLKRLIHLFGPQDVHVEIQRHHLRSEQRIGDSLIAIAQAHQLPLLATNGVLYAEPAGREVLDVMTCIRHHTHLDAAGLLLAQNSHCSLKRPDEMQALFADFPEAILNTERLAGRLEFTLHDLGYAFPDFAVRDGQSMDSELRKLAFFGAQQRYGSIISKVRRQLDKELELISRLGFAGYFLIVWDIVNFAREEGILVQGRGSAANSVVCYVLGITAVDPIGSKLLFERFLSENRKTWPDIDLDLPSGDLREKVIQEVFRRYGSHGAAMTANVITYRGRTAMREIGKALHFPEELLKRFSDLFPYGDFASTIELEDQVTQAGIPRSHPRFTPLVRLYQQVYGLPRHLGQHSGGMVICKGRLDEVVPLENASMPNRVVVQWDKDDCEDLGIVKVDFLGLGMMAVLQDAMELSHKRGHPVDLAHIPKDDAATYDLMQKADTVGTFQVESRAQMASLPRMKPKVFYDVAVQVAIIRPGPIVGQLVHPYIARRTGKQPITYFHPDVKPILERTLGVALFQEQMLSMSMLLADFDGGEADELRRSISFKRSDERMKKMVAKLRLNMTKKGIAEEIQDHMVNSLNSFALYGFPESHAISFALLAYSSCWLKVHRPSEFYCALLNNQPMGFYAPPTLIKDGQRRGIKFRPVCVVRSEFACIIEEDGAVRLGFNYVQGMRADSAQRLLTARASQPFTHLNDLLSRVPLNKAERRVLAKIGAFNQLSSHRRAAQWDVEAYVDPDDLFNQGICVAESSSSSTEAAPAAETPPRARLKKMTSLERLHADFDGTRVTTGPHPMTFLRTDENRHLRRAEELKNIRHGKIVTVAGLVICRQRPGTANGHMFISLEDETGIANIFVLCELFERNRLIITQEPFLEIQGMLQNKEDVLSVLARKISPIRAVAGLKTQSHDFH